MVDAMEEDECVFLFGEDVVVVGGLFKIIEGFFERFGFCCVRDMLIFE